MRIIGGKFRGRVLSGFKGSEIRPTADRVKESLFNILAPEIHGASMLDLFCGCGNVGLEAISRGADYVVFNDVSKESLALLKKKSATTENGRADLQLRLPCFIADYGYGFRYYFYRSAV